MNTSEWDRKEEERTEVKNQNNESLFIVERFRPLIQVKSILLFYDFFLFVWI